MIKIRVFDEQKKVVVRTIETHYSALESVIAELIKTHGKFKIEVR